VTDAVISVSSSVDVMSGRCELEINGEVVVTLWAPRDYARFQMVAWTANECASQDLALSHTLACVREHAEGVTP
jgi:hypothetical protein